MTKKLIFLVIGIISLSALADSHFRYNNNKGWYSYNQKTGMRRYVSSFTNVSDPRYKERNNPVQGKSDSRSEDQFRRYNPTHNNLGNDS